MLQKKEYQQHLTKTNVTKEGLPTTTKIPVTPTKTNATKEETTNNNTNKN